MNFINNAGDILKINACFLHGSFCQEISVYPGERGTIKYDDGTEVTFSEKATNENNHFFVPHDRSLSIGRGSTTFVITRVK